MAKKITSAAGEEFFFILPPRASPPPKIVSRRNYPEQGHEVFYWKTSTLLSTFFGHVLLMIYGFYRSLLTCLPILGTSFRRNPFQEETMQSRVTKFFTGKPRTKIALFFASTRQHLWFLSLGNRRFLERGLRARLGKLLIELFAQKK